MTIDPYLKPTTRSKLTKLDYQRLRVLALIAYQDERAYPHLTETLSKRCNPSASAEHIKIKLKSAYIGFMAALRVSTLLSSIPTSVEVLDTNGAQLSTLANVALRNVRCRLIVCLGTPIFLYRHSFNSQIYYKRMASKAAPRKRVRPTIPTNTDIRTHITVHERESTLNDEFIMFNDDHSIHRTPSFTASGYYLGSTSTVSSKSEPAVQTDVPIERAWRSGTAVRDADRADASTTAAGARADGCANDFPTTQDTSNSSNSEPVVQTNVNAERAMRSWTTVREADRADASTTATGARVESSPDLQQFLNPGLYAQQVKRGPIIRIYGVKWRENGLNLAEMLAYIVREFDVSTRFSQVHLTNCRRIARYGRRRRSTKVRNVPRCHAVWSRSASLHRFCRTKRSGKIPGLLFDYNRDIRWVTYPQNVRYRHAYFQQGLTPPKSVCLRMFNRRLKRSVVKIVSALNTQVNTLGTQIHEIIPGRSKLDILNTLGFRFASLNIQGIAGKLRDLAGILNYLSVGCLALQETWRHKDWAVKVDGYTWVGGSGKSTGGVRMMRGMGFLVSDVFARVVLKCKDKELCSNSDILWAKCELYHNKSRKAYIGNVYLATHGLNEAKVIKLLVFSHRW